MTHGGQQGAQAHGLWVLAAARPFIQWLLLICKTTQQYLIGFVARIQRDDPQELLNTVPDP